jgi:regulator of protease activity HflC (stomatin/prohibitin superfamily)
MFGLVDVTRRFKMRRWQAWALVCAAVWLMGCATVPAGHRGIRVYLLGGDKGVDEVELGVGRYAYWPITQEIFVFPVFQQNHIWSRKDRAGDRSITFQTKEGLSVNGDFGISYSVDETKVTVLFQKYRRGLEEITDLFLRNMVRDALNMEASRMAIEDVYGEQRQALLRTVEQRVREQVEPYGLIIDRLYSVGDFRLPPVVVTAINAKIEATQRAQQRENEVREARAQAAKQIAQSEGDAESVRIRAKAEADANAQRAAALTPALIEYEAVMRWDGVLPQVVGAGGVLPPWLPGIGGAAGMMCAPAAEEGAAPKKR